MTAQEMWRSTGTGPKPEDDVPTEEMLKTVRGGGLSMAARIIPREAAIPAPDMVEKVDIAIIDSREGGTPSYVFSLNGANDETMKKIANSYAANRRGAKLSTEDRIADIGALFMEVCAAKRQEGQDPIEVEAKPQYSDIQSPAKPQASVPAKRSRSTVQVTFDLGPAGRMVGRYKDVMIQDKLLILVADEEAVASGQYLPPSTDPDKGQTILVTIPDLDIPVPVFSLDLVFQYGGNVFCLMIIDRDDAS